MRKLHETAPYPPPVRQRASRSEPESRRRAAILQSPLTDSNRRSLLTIAPKRLPWVATACGSACLNGLRGCSICHRLPLVAPARLHKCSIPSLGIADGQTPLGVQPSARECRALLSTERTRSRPYLVLPGYADSSAATAP